MIRRIRLIAASILLAASIAMRFAAISRADSEVPLKEPISSGDRVTSKQIIALSESRVGQPIVIADETVEPVSMNVPSLLAWTIHLYSIQVAQFDEIAWS